MEIRPDPGGLERKRAAERDQRTAATNSAKSGSKAGSSGPAALDQSTVSSYVQVLANQDPARLHKVEDLRQRIADGTYTADPEELVDPLLDAIEQDR